MPGLPTWSGFTGSNLNADELATQLWNTSTGSDSFDLLNGGLDSTNWTGSVLPTWSIQPGSFVAGYYYGFDRRDFVYALQSSEAYSPPSTFDGYGLVASLTHSLFVPFDAEVVLFGYQAWCQQLVDEDQQFVLYSVVNGSPLTSLNTGLPCVGDAAVDDHENFEFRHRFVSASSMLRLSDITSTSAAQSKGRLTFELFVFGNADFYGDFSPNVAFVTGGFWALAIR